MKKRVTKIEFLLNKYLSLEDMDASFFEHGESGTAKFGWKWFSVNQEVVRRLTGIGIPCDNRFVRFICYTVIYTVLCEIEKENKNETEVSKQTNKS